MQKFRDKNNILTKLLSRMMLTSDARAGVTLPQGRGHFLWASFQTDTGEEGEHSIW